ncbi:hypothetical protein DICPUDRAFT_154381 [Dictyostelium purpureum]|uniref:Carbohydrate binding domain-containing protein n=1 Tax=Dictyostelium purpureum TaxID=5786 RepID=F0ZR74_DICPU|nr:uncharacterized protein DICPUDRAFT_154381 [Dictyostelium purpureum]EGC33548.1 hypothetical protein DICPUDRAFT_154381 [Dictyostelium purpureum]|eukprot:XP_003289930.1 hypothetical protein DICPUDRAFT_154381 [Dictyostelium purpureum]
MNIKLLVTLIILLISFSNAISININKIPSESMGKKSDGGCGEKKGFTANYEIVADNINIAVSNFIAPDSYFERGTYIVDYENQLSVWDFNSTTDGVIIIGKAYGFIRNSTQYYVYKVNGVEMCTKGILQTNLIENISISKKVGSTNVGSHQFDVYENFTPVYNLTQQYAVYDPNDCSLVSLHMSDSVLYSGQAILNVYDYKPYVDVSRTQVPSLCFE